MTIAYISFIRGGTDLEDTILKCTGCDEYYTYSWRQWKGDFSGNISDYEQFLKWAKWNAAQHECFLAGRTGYVVEPPSELERHASQPERHEDPWGGVGYVVEPEDDPALFEHERFPWEDDDYDPDEDDWDEPDVDEDNDYAEEPYDPMPPYTPLDAAKGLDFARLYELGLGPPDDDDYDWEEGRFDYLYDYYTDEGGPSGAVIRVYVEFDYAAIEQLVLDEALLNLGVYTEDAAGNLRDEKGRCLTCIRSHDRIMAREEQL